jgi:hypothetical protein
MSININLVLFEIYPHFSAKTDIKTSFNSLSIIAVAPHTTCPSISKAGTLCFSRSQVLHQLLFYR